MGEFRGSLVRVERTHGAVCRVEATFDHILTQVGKTVEVLEKELSGRLQDVANRPKLIRTVSARGRGGRSTDAPIEVPIDKDGGAEGQALEGKADDALPAVKPTLLRRVSVSLASAKEDMKHDEAKQEAGRQ